MTSPFETPADPGRSFSHVSTDDLAKRLTALASDRELHRDEWEGIQAELAQRRLAAAAPPPPIAPSLRSQVLALLAGSPGSTPSQIAGSLERSTTVVSRVLAILLQAGLIEYDSDPNDGRVRLYRLATAASDGSEPPLAPSEDEQERQYIALVVAAAVRARRQSNDLEYATDRLGRILDQADKLGAADLALVARRELMTSLRQAGRYDELAPHLTALRDIAIGNVTIDPHLVAPATGCLDYELGREESRPSRERIERLAAAATAFQRCQGIEQAQDWSPREAWSLLASAELWREQTEFGVALAHAERAATIFRDFDDAYGAAEAYRVLGFCQRLRGDFAGAVGTLTEAARWAKEGQSNRCFADVLMQLGDAHRCAGDRELARDHLEEAALIARELNRSRTLGFSLSALAALAFSEESYEVAWATATEAEGHLTSSPTGNALNTRRRAAIARELGDSPRGASDRALRLFRSSLEQYIRLESPAGVAASCVGIGRTTADVETHSAAVDQLVKVASSASGRLLLPIDPWIPSLVRRWAEDSGLPDVKRVADWTFSSDKHNPNADEMAGEPRVESRLLAA